jgi:hypothetical protein
VAVAGLTVLAAVGGQIDRDIQGFREGTLRRAALTVDLRGALKNTEIVSLEYALIENEPRRVKLRAKLSGTLLPTVNAALVATEGELGESSGSDTPAPLRRISSDWQLYLERYGPALLAADAAGEQGAAVKIRSLLDGSIADAELLADSEAAHAATELQNASAAADSVRTRLIVVALIAGLIASGIAIALTRSIVRRARHYSRFAVAVAAGSYGERVKVRGNDELTDLGELLNRMTEHRDVEQTRETQRLDFTDAMQLTGSEGEAHRLLKQSPGALDPRQCCDRPEPQQQRRPTRADDHARGCGSHLRDSERRAAARLPRRAKRPRPPFHGRGRLAGVQDLRSGGRERMPAASGRRRGDRRGAGAARPRPPRNRD